MVDIGQMIFRTGQVKASSPVKIMQRFLVIYTFDDTTTPSTDDIDTYIFNSDDKHKLVFSPKGHLYFTELDSNGNLASNPTSSFPNPINPFETYSDSFTNWSPIDYTKFTAFNTAFPFPQFFPSLSDGFGSGVSGTGYMLYRDTVWTGKISDGSKYYLLYNPFNRIQSNGNILANTQNNTFSIYCQNINFQDESCYCLNDNNNRCLYAFAGSQTAGDTILNIDLSNASPSALQSINGVKVNCGCNKICQNWSGKNALETKPNCSSSTTNVICGVNVSAAEKSSIQLAGGIQTTQNCSANTQDGSGQQGQAGTPNIILPLTIAVVVIVAVMIGGILFLKK